MFMTATVLSDKQCVPCEGGAALLGTDEAHKLMKQTSQWKFCDDFRCISRTFSFSKYVDAIPFVGNVAQIAEVENHHPDMRIGYKKVTITCTTHAIHGLSENDFILAAKINKLQN
jgi:4a-hydroxytetrahydrobiopterin dehydratase